MAREAGRQHRAREHAGRIAGRIAARPGRTTQAALREDLMFDYQDVTPPPGCYMVAVDPHGGTTPPRPPNSGGYSEVFTVTNTGSQSDGYTFTCAGSANVSCTGVSPSSVFLNSLQSTTVTAFYSVGTVGDGTVSLTASGTFDSDQGWYTIPVGTYGVAVERQR